MRESKLCTEYEERSRELNVPLTEGYTRLVPEIELMLVLLITGCACAAPAACRGVTGRLGRRIGRIRLAVVILGASGTNYRRHRWPDDIATT